MIKIVSQNVNGLSDFKESGKLDKLFENNADIYCLLELKTNNEKKITDMFGENISNKYNIVLELNKDKRNYGGLTILMNKETVDKILVAIDEPEFESEYLSNSSKGRTITLYFANFLLVVTNMMNHSPKTKKEKNAYQRMLNVYISKLKSDFNLPIIVVCNFSTNQDYEQKNYNELTIQNNLLDVYKYWNTNVNKNTLQQTNKNGELVKEITDHIFVDNRIKKYITSADINKTFDGEHKPLELNLNITGPNPLI